MVPTYEITEKFHCENCNYSTSRKSQYDRHLQTNKHKILQNPTLKSSEPKWYCPCGKKYKHSSTLYAHKKKCTFETKDAFEQSQMTNQQVIETLLKFIQNGNIN